MSFESCVKVIHIGLVMATVVNVHGCLVDVWF